MASGSNAVIACGYAVTMTQSIVGKNPPYLLLGASGAVGLRVLARLSARGDEITALSRQLRPQAQANTQWYQHNVYHDDPNALPTAAVVISAGPLDGMAVWAARANWREGTRLVALSSLSAETKADSDNTQERALAKRLRECEAALLALGKARGWQVTVIRASLIYDPQSAQLSLDRLLALAKRMHFLPLPRDANGLRQPVHADDLAQALLACTESDGAANAVLRLAGGERIAFAQMVARYLAMHGATARIVWLPGWSARMLQALLPLLGRRGRSIASQLARSRHNLVIDNGDWLQIGVTPRSFCAPKRDESD
jgi:nucleoside-diphosphate-sugar epimerase